MAVTLEELQIKFTAQMGGLTSQLNGVKSQLAGVSTSAVKTSNAFAGLARAAKYFVGAFLVKGIFDIGKSSLEMANDVVESESLFRVSMKGMSGAARDWSESLSQSLGLNAYELRKNVGVFNTMFMSMGLGEQKAYDMATGLTELANDMASFYNLSTEEAFDKLRAGITGETEPLKRLGIMVDDNTIKQYAMAAGLTNTGKELTQSEKLLARYQAILAQTSNAQGDLARTIDSPVNRLRMLGAQFDQAKIAFGQALQPLQAAVIPVLIELAKAATVAAQGLAYLMGALGGFGGVGVFANQVSGAGAEVNEDLADSLNESAKAYKKAGGAAKKASKDAKIGLKAFDEINQLTEETTKTGGGGAKLDEVEVPDITPASGYADALSVISDKVKEAAEAIKKFWEGLKNSALGTIVEGAFDALKWLWTDVIKPFGTWALSNPDVIGNVLAGIGTAIAVWEVGKFISGANGVSGIAGALASLGKTIAAHPVLFAVAAIAGGLVFLAGSIDSAREAAIREENEKRFGSLALSLDKLRNAVSSIKTPFSTAMSNLRSDFNALAQAGQQLRALADSNAELVYGYRLKPEAFTKEKADELVNSVQDEVDSQSTLLESAQIKATMGLEALFAGTSQDGSEILKLNAENWEKVKEQGAKLGKEYLDAVTDAAFDGKISAEEQQKIYALQAKMLEMMMIATDPEALIAKMEIRKIGMDFDGATLTAESVKDFNQTLNEKSAELMELVEQEGKSVIDYALAVAIQANPSITNAELKNVQSTAQKAFDEQKLKVKWEIEQVRINAPFGEVLKAYKDVLKGAKPAVDAFGKDYVTSAMEMMLNAGFTADSLNTRDGSRMLGVAISELMYNGVKATQIPEGATKEAMQSWLKTFRPDYTKWKEMEAEYKRLGLNIPTALADGIYNYEAMLAVSGSISDMANYVAGQDIIDTTSWSSEGKDAIDSIVAAFNAGQTDIKTAAAKIVEIMESEIAKADLTAEATMIIKGVEKGLTSDKSKETVTKSVQSLTSLINTNFKNFEQIKSPSRVFMGYGEMIAAGLAQGINNGMDIVAPAMKNLEGSTRFNAQPVESGGTVQNMVEAVLNGLNISLNVDGETWGRASVKHINNAQRASGKLLLEM